MQNITFTHTVFFFIQSFKCTARQTAELNVMSRNFWFTHGYTYFLEMWIHVSITKMKVSIEACLVGHPDKKPVSLSKNLYKDIKKYM